MDGEGTNDLHMFDTGESCLIVSLIKHKYINNMSSNTYQLGCTTIVYARYLILVTVGIV